MSQHSTTVPAASPAAYRAAREHAAFLDRSARGRIVVSGADRANYLQGLLTNDISALTSGKGCYALYLTAQGRMISDLWVHEVGDVILLHMEGDVKDTVLAKLDQFIFSEDVQLGDVTDTFAQVAVLGPEAAPVVAAAVKDVSRETLDAMAEHDTHRGTIDGSPVIVSRILDLGEPGYELFAERATLAAVAEEWRRAGVVELDQATADTIRIEAGVPRFHRDMDETTIPLEAGIESRAISFTKGCYVGQEVIIRVLHRGHGRVARRLVGLRLEGVGPSKLGPYGPSDVPASGAVVRSGDREIGHVTTATLSPSLSRPIALAYLHRDFVEPGTAVSVGDHGAAEVVALPFV